MKKLSIFCDDIIDLDQWGGIVKTHYENIDNIYLDGLHQINIDSQKLYFYMKNTDKIKSNNKVIFSFNGAVSNREKKKGPFFTLLGVANRLEVPVISFSDDSTVNSDSLGLGWYAGNERIVDLPEKIAKIIDEFCIKNNVKPFLIGGSGGGFASLNVANYLENAADIFIWNPQTDLTKYYKRHVQNYYNCSFPSLKSKSFNYKTEYIKKTLSCISLCEKEMTSKHNILYFQNKSDEHYNIHAVPFIEINKYNKKNKNLYVKNNSIIITPNWGVGHIEPPLYVVEYVISEIMKNNLGDNIVYNISKLFSCFDFDF